ncbi:hypothetical protein [Oligoflexus sp.]|uniref:hypothetical protein n=1 Tax=Oligoflexus sp. TaxID=1971216 RepID=UPI002D78F702|nr:hypothetical protein [Oligoflexus sp.]
MVWLNEFGGEIRSSQGQTFGQSGLYESIRDRVVAIIKIQDPDELTLKDISAQQNLFLTYEEVRENPGFKLMQKSRLHRVQKSIYSQLDLASGVWAIQ